MISEGVVEKSRLVLLLSNLGERFLVCNFFFEEGGRFLPNHLLTLWNYFCAGLCMGQPPSLHQLLRTASLVAPPEGSYFRSEVFGNEWDSFAEEWLPTIATFVSEALAGWGTEPRPVILPLSAGMHAAWASASFNPVDGQVSLSPSTAGNPGLILEKLTHEFVHAALSEFPEGDPFYEEGFVDYGTWLLAHAPVWRNHRAGMIAAAEKNIELRRERAMKSLSDYDAKRWAGGVFAHAAYGPLLINRLRMRKLEGNYTW